jgi:hypothetical protein
MPKATIVSEVGEGEYFIKIEYDLVRAKRVKEQNKARIIVVNKAIAKLQTSVNELTTIKNNLADDLNAAIAAEAAATPAGEELSVLSSQKVKYALSKVTKASANLSVAEDALNSDVYTVTQWQKEIDRIDDAISKYDDPDPVEAWCADHTLELTGEVGTLELQDETNKKQNQPTIIQPEGIINDTKVIQPVISSGSMAVVYNWAALPAVQKWRPLYRNGIISNINLVNNTADVSFSGTHEFSSVRGFYFNEAYSIFRDTKILEIDIVYMQCHAEAFHENDKVVVQFEAGAIPSGETEPEYIGTVIGFVTNPYLCPIRVYLESGFLDLRSIGQCAETTYLPALLHFDTETAAYNLSLSAPMQLGVELIPSRLDEDSPLFGDVPTDGQASLAVGCAVKDQLASIIDPCHNLYVAGGYCSGMVQKKQAQGDIPASMFSGKLRLFVQAMYGSTNKDVSYDKGDAFSLKVTNEINITQKVLTKSFTGGSFLYTTDNYDYFICTYDAAVLKFTELLINQSGRAIQEQLRIRLAGDELIVGPTTPLFIKRVESLILASATINEENSIVILLNGATIEGAPLDYGWHSNWKGDEATVVCTKEGAGTTLISNQYQLKITEAFNEVSQKYTFSAVVTTLSANNEYFVFANGMHNFFYDAIDNSMYPVKHSDGAGDTTGSFDAPIYNYYDHDEITGISDLKTVKANFSVNYSGYVVIPAIPNGTKKYTPETYIVTSTIEGNGNAGNKGFSIDGVGSIDATVGSSTYSRIRTFEYVGMGWIGQLNGQWHSDSIASQYVWANQYGYNIGDYKAGFYDGNPVTLRLGFQAGALAFISSVVETDIEAKSSLVFGQIMVGSNDEFFMGKEQSLSHQGSTEIRTGLYWSPQYSGRLVWYYAGLHQIGEVLATGVPDTFFKHYNYYTGSDLGTIITPATNETSYEISRATDEVVTVKEDDTAGDARYFSPGIINPATGTIDYSRRSISGKSKVTHTIGSLDDGFLHHSSVGWQ